MPRLYMVPLSICAVALFLCVASEAAFSQAGSQPSPASIRQQMIDLQKAFVEAEERGDADYVKSAVADDFTSIETNGGTSGKDDLVRDIHPPERPGSSAILYEFKVIELDETCAVVTYNAVFPASHLDRYQHLSNTWAKRNGRWQLVFQQSTLNLWSAHDLD